MIIMSLSLQAFSQDSMEKVMEKRAREMHRVLGLSDRGQWKTFIQENYTQALINKPMRAAVKESTGATTSSESQSADNLEAKVNMFNRLHDDFGGSKITSIKSSDGILKMTLDNGSGLIGVFQLKFVPTKPYLIDGLGIQAEN